MTWIKAMLPARLAKCHHHRETGKATSLSIKIPAESLLVLNWIEDSGFQFKQSSARQLRL